MKYKFFNINSAILNIKKYIPPQVRKNMYLLDTFFSPKFNITFF